MAPEGRGGVEAVPELMDGCGGEGTLRVRPGGGEGDRTGTATMCYY